MLPGKQISAIQKIYVLLPQPELAKPQAIICSECNYIDATEYLFCTNCGYPLKNKMLVNEYRKKLKEKSNLLFKAETSVFFARSVLYVMGAFLSLGILFIFAESRKKYIVVMLAIFFSGLFFFLAVWSRKNPFIALLTAFILLITFSAIDIFGKLVQSFTTLQGMAGMLICLALLFVVLKGVQGAYHINLINQQTQVKL